MSRFTLRSLSSSQLPKRPSQAAPRLPAFEFQPPLLTMPRPSLAHSCSSGRTQLAGAFPLKSFWVHADQAGFTCVSSWSSQSWRDCSRASSHLASFWRGGQQAQRRQASLKEVTQQVRVFALAPATHKHIQHAQSVFCSGKLRSQAPAVAKGPQGFVFKGEMNREVFLSAAPPGSCLAPSCPSCPGKASFTVASATHGKQQTPKIDDTQAQEWKELAHGFKRLF